MSLICIVNGAVAIDINKEKHQNKYGYKVKNVSHTVCMPHRLYMKIISRVVNINYKRKNMASIIVILVTVASQLMWILMLHSRHVNKIWHVDENLWFVGCDRRQCTIAYTAFGLGQKKQRKHKEFEKENYFF